MTASADSSVHDLLGQLLVAEGVTDARRIVLEGAPAAVGCDRVGLVLPSTGNHLLLYDDPTDPELSAGTLLLDDAHLAGEAIIHGTLAWGRGDRAHERLSRLPLVLAAPLSAKEGIAGAILYGWDDLRDLDERVARSCTNFAVQVAAALERTRYRQREALLVQALRGDIETTREQIPGLDVYGRYLPPWSGIPLGGDWHDVWTNPDGTVSMVVGDVVGHGVDVSPTMLTLRSYVRAAMVDAGDLDAALRNVDRMLDLFDHDHGLASLLVAEYDPRTATLSWLNAGLPDPLVRRIDGSVDHLGAGRTRPVGTGLERPRIEPGSETLGRGATVVAFTDGLLLPMLEDVVDMSAIGRALARVGTAPLAAVADELLALTPGDLRVDDASVLVMRVTEEHLSGYDSRPPRVGGG